MKILIKFVSLIGLISVISCTGNKLKMPDGESTDTSLLPSVVVKDSTSSDNQEADIERLKFWTSKDICKTNPELVSLLDTLYRYARENRTIEDEMKWMKAYLRQVCDYYDRRKLGSDTISCYEKADIVLSQAETLWETDRDCSTMGMTIYNDIYDTWCVFKQYRILMQLSDLCKNKQQRDFLMEEWRAWSKFEGCFEGFWGCCVDLSYWGATGASPVRIAGYASARNTHINLNQREIAWINGSYDTFEVNGVLLQPTKTLFFDCCKTILQSSCSIEYLKENEYYKQQYDEALKEYREMKTLMDNWIEARSKWADAVSTDYWRGIYDRSTSEVLLKLSSIISSLDD